LDLNVRDFNFTVRDKGLLDITSNITHGGIECNKRKRGSQEICVGDGKVDQSCLNDSIDFKKLAKRHRSQAAGDSIGNVDNKFVTKSNSTPVKKLFVRMKFPTPSTKMKNYSLGNEHDTKPNTVNHCFESPNVARSSKQKQNGKKNNRTLTENGQTPACKRHYKKCVHDQGSRNVGTVTDSHLTNSIKLKKASGWSKTSFTHIKTDNELLAYRDFCSAVTTNFTEAANNEQWVPPQSPYNLVEESLYYSSWRLLIASLLLEKGQG